MMQRRINPATLVAARCSRRYTQTELGRRAEITVSSLSRLESGQRRASDDEVERLSQALGYSPETLAEQLPAAAFGLPGFYHRKFSRASVRDVRWIEGQCLMSAIGLRRLMDMIEVETPYQIEPIDIDEFKGDAERAAAAIRLQWQLPRGPIADLCTVIEHAGALVVHFDFEIEAMDAIYQTVPGLPPVFWVNSRKPADRVRFSLAHELGHAVLHDVPMDPDEAERQADAFAAAFLMPASDFRSECPTRITLQDLAQLKRRWRTSMAAIIRRAHNVGRISKTQYESLMIQMSRKGWRKHEPVQLATERPELLPALMEKSLQYFGGDREELATILRVPETMVRDWMQRWPARASMGDNPTLRLVM